jgi:VIT1/CCC1 family predicted Fe2+/Mn2+ transporter
MQTGSEPVVHPHAEHHYGGRIGWLRAAVLGANDGIVSTASLIVGVASADPDRAAVLLAGVAGLVAGAMSMAAGEYVSVSSQADTERADLTKEAQHIETDREFEVDELAEIYVSRGVRPELAHEVARDLMAHDALAAHARDELGISDLVKARPVQAALTSAAAFAAGAAVPLLAATVASQPAMISAVGATSLGCLAALGAIAARIGGASPVIGAVRVGFWGAFAMALTALAGRLVGAAV